MEQLNLRKIENLHILLWLLKDLGWVKEYTYLGMSMIAPTLLVAIWITWKMRKEFSELTHNIAVCCWITANSIWMTGEFFYKDTTREIATIFFVLGITSIAIHYTKELFDFVRMRGMNQISA